MAYTKRDGWVWSFCLIDHFTAEAWTTVAKRGDRFACLEPIYDAVTDRFGRVDENLARGIALRHDWGRNTPLVTSRARSHGSGSRTALRSPENLRATAAPNASSGPSRSSACGLGSTKTSRTCARR